MRLGYLLCTCRRRHPQWESGHRVDVWLLRQLRGMHRHVLRAVLHGGQGSGDHRSILLPARLPGAHPDCITNLPFSRPQRRPCRQEHRRQPVRRLSLSLVLPMLLSHPRGSRDQSPLPDRRGWRRSDYQARLSPLRHRQLWNSTSLRPEAVRHIFPVRIMRSFLFTSFGL